MTQADELGAAYAFDGPALELGAPVLDGEARQGARIRVPLSMLNRHGLLAGTTGTGKTKTLKLMAEQLSDAGVPVFLADIKGDVSGMAAPGVPSDRITKRAQETATGRPEASRSSSSTSAARAAPAYPCGRPSRASGRSCSARCWD
jgi:hypothetical protein